MVRIEGQGGPGKTNKDGVGAVISLTTPDGVTQTAFVTSRPSLGSGGDLSCHFGLGQMTEVSELRVRWTTGVETVHPVSAVDQRIFIVEP